MDFLLPNLELREEWRVTTERLSFEMADGIRKRAAEILRDCDPLLPHIVEIKLVRNQRKNFLNIRIKNEYMKIFYFIRCEDIFVCFAPVYNFQPFVRVFVLHRCDGVMFTLPPPQLEVVKSSLAEFVKKYGLTRERYTLLFGQAGQTDCSTFAECLPHYQDGKPFLLHIRVASAMYRDKLALLAALPYDAIRALLPSLSSDRNAATQQLTGVCAYLRPMLDIRNGSHALDIEINRNYVPTLFAEEHDGVLYCFFASDKIEPYVIITATGRAGRLLRLTRLQLEHLSRAIDSFKRKFGIEREQYHYTDLGERESTEAFVRGGGADTASKAHSAHFHLKMRVSTSMCLDVLRVLQCVDFARMRETLEPVRYNYSREAVDWAAALARMQADVLD